MSANGLRHCISQEYLGFGSNHFYGVRLCSAQTLRDQLGLVPGTKSKIEDGSREGTSVTLATAVADFRKRLRFAP